MGAVGTSEVVEALPFLELPAEIAVVGVGEKLVRHF